MTTAQVVRGILEGIGVKPNHVHESQIRAALGLSRKQLSRKAYFHLLYGIGGRDGYDYNWQTAALQ